MHALHTLARVVHWLNLLSSSRGARFCASGINMLHVSRDGMYPSANDFVYLLYASCGYLYDHPQLFCRSLMLNKSAVLYIKEDPREMLFRNEQKSRAQGSPSFPYIHEFVVRPIRELLLQFADTRRCVTVYDGGGLATPSKPIRLSRYCLMDVRIRDPEKLRTFINRCREWTATHYNVYRQPPVVWTGKVSVFDSEDLLNTLYPKPGVKETTTYLDELLSGTGLHFRDASWLALQRTLFDSLCHVTGYSFIPDSRPKHRSKSI